MFIFSSIHSSHHPTAHFPISPSTSFPIYLSVSIQPSPHLPVNIHHMPGSPGIWHLMCPKPNSSSLPPHCQPHLFSGAALKERSDQVSNCIGKLQAGCTSNSLVSDRSQTKRTQIVWFHFYKMPTKGKSIQISCCLGPEIGMTSDYKWAWSFFLRWWKYFRIRLWRWQSNSKNRLNFELYA